MWTKILGTVCAGLFVGAAVVEYKQIKLRKREEKERDAAADDEPETAPGEQGDEPAPTTP